MRYIGLDIETDGLDPYGGRIWMVAINYGKKISVYEDCHGNCQPYFKELKSILEDNSICKIIHNAAFDMSFTEMKTGIRIRNVWDTMLCEVVIQSLQLPANCKDVELLKAHSSKLKYVLPRYGFPEPDKTIVENFINRPVGKKFSKVEIDYVKHDVKYLISLQKAQEYLLTRENLLEVALLENLNVERVANASVHGIGWDGKIWNDIAESNEKEFAFRMAQLPKQVNNWNSPLQVKNYFRSIGVDLPSFSVMDEVYLQTRNPILGNFIYARELHKSCTSYGKNWFAENFCDPDGRIRASIQQIVNTARYSMYSPNLQQLPGEGTSNPKRLYVLKLIAKQYGKEGKLKPQHRKAFVPRKGYIFVIGDFSGQEMGIMASQSGEDLWIDAMLRGDDIHSITASLLYKNEWAQGGEKNCAFPKKCACPAHVELRSPTKILNFMLAYGGGETKFSENTGITKDLARKVIKNYRKVVPRLTMWLNKNGRDSLRDGVSYSADPYKRRRILKAEEDWKVTNQGKNSPIQMAGANMLKLSMNSIPWEYYIPLVIHDEIILEVKKSSAAKACKVLKKVMEDSADYITGIKGLVKVTPRIANNLMKD